MSNIYLYLRVSSDKQDVDTQRHALLQRYPDGIVVSETASGIKARPQLQALFDRLQTTDTLVIAALDRLGRKTSEILNRIEALQKRGVNVVSLREGLDYSTPAGRMMVQVMAAVAELERSLIAQRTKAALGALKAKGVRLGRPTKHGPETVAKAKELRASGATYAQISERTGVATGHLARILAA